MDEDPSQRAPGQVAQASGTRQRAAIAGVVALVIAAGGTAALAAVDGSGYGTYAVQTGEITALDDDSVSLRSADGYTRTYELGGAAPDDLDIGDQAQLIARVTDGTTAVVHLTEPPTGPLDPRPNGLR